MHINAMYGLTTRHVSPFQIEVHSVAFNNVVLSSAFV